MPAADAKAAEQDWVSRLADQVVAESQRRAPGQPVVCGALGRYRSCRTVIRWAARVRAT